MGTWNIFCIKVKNISRWWKLIFANSFMPNLKRNVSNFSSTHFCTSFDVCQQTTFCTTNSVTWSSRIKCHNLITRVTVWLQNVFCLPFFVFFKFLLRVKLVDFFAIDADKLPYELKGFSQIFFYRELAIRKISEWKLWIF